MLYLECGRIELFYGLISQINNEQITREGLPTSCRRISFRVDVCRARTTFWHGKGQVHSLFNGLCKTAPQVGIASVNTSWNVLRLGAPNFEAQSCPSINSNRYRWF